MPDVTLIGYPLGSTGRAEHVRAVWRALTAARVPAKIHDISGHRSSDEGLEREFRPAVIEQLSAGLRIYSLNGTR